MNIRTGGTQFNYYTKINDDKKYSQKKKGNPKKNPLFISKAVGRMMFCILEHLMTFWHKIPFFIFTISWKEYFYEILLDWSQSLLSYEFYRKRVNECPPSHSPWLKEKEK